MISWSRHYEQLRFSVIISVWCQERLLLGVRDTLACLDSASSPFPTMPSRKWRWKWPVVTSRISFWERNSNRWLLQSALWLFLILALHLFRGKTSITLLMGQSIKLTPNGFSLYHRLVHLCLKFLFKIHYTKFCISSAQIQEEVITTFVLFPLETKAPRDQESKFNWGMFVRIGLGGR